jgi:lycopene cyclase domain-containing protein
MMLFFIPWDIIFTSGEIWGFNEAYITGLTVFGLPIEEWLFFICIPYACMFTHYALHSYFPNVTLAKQTTSVIYVTIQTVLIVTLWYYYDKWYTLINFLFAILLLGYVYNYKNLVLRQFLPTFIIILIPFFIVNGILTGTGIEDQVVWYDHSENLNLKLFTIPIEDSIYALGMLLSVLLVMEWNSKPTDQPA